MTLLVPTEVAPYVDSVRGRTRMDDAIAVLASAAADAAEMGLDAWQFAVEFEALAARGLTTVDLRWLALKGLVQHAIEQTKPGQFEREFDHEVGPTTIGNKTCVTLTPLGDRVAEQLLARARRCTRGVPHRFPIPVWSPELHELRLGGVLVKRFRVPAHNQQIVLSVFEEERWPERIDDPLPCKKELVPKRILRDTIRSLNSHQTNSLIRFYG